ncbi:MAG: hypothetical protein IT384_23930, partial [Deltaproteobacteria bacterium]|nr:hypothetical protein [Deltaproteobacteria bacterium]
LSHAAKRLNKLDRVRGAVFERRFAEIPILDEEALAERIAYAVNNPVEANLVRRRKEWTGLCLFAGTAPSTHRFTVFNEARYQRALRDAPRTGTTINRSDFFETARLELGVLEHDLPARVGAVVDSREAELRAAQPGVLGMRRVLDASPFDRPSLSSRTKMPLCFGTTRDIRSDFIATWCEFVDAFRRASKAFRGGVLTAVFPAFSFRPGSAIV